MADEVSAHRTDTGEKDTDEAPAGPTEPETLHYDRHPVVFVALLVTLVVDTVLAASIAVLNLSYGHGADHLLGMAVWLAVALINAVGVWNVARARPAEFANVLLAQITALVMAGYVLLVDYQSPDPNAAVRWTALLVAAVAVGWIVHVFVTEREPANRTFSRSWKVVSASFVLMSLFSLWLTTSYLPSTARPMVDLTTALTKVDQSSKTTVLKATITLHNRGQAAAVVVGSVYRIYYHADETLPFTGPVAIDQFNFGSEVGFSNHQDDVLAQAFDFTGRNDHSFTGSINVLKADEILPMREFLLPGQTWSTEAVVDVPTAAAATVRLTAQIALITGRYLGDTTACNGGKANQLDPAFDQQAHTVWQGATSAASDSLETTDLAAASTTADPSTTSTLGDTSTTAATSAIASGASPSGAQRQVDFMCVQTAIQPQSAVQDLVGNRPFIRSYYVLTDGDVGQDRVPYLVTSYGTGTGATDENGKLRQAQKIDAQNPSTVIDSRSEYGLPGTTG